MEPMTIAGAVVVSVAAGAVFSTLFKGKNCCSSSKESSCKEADAPVEDSSVENRPAVKEPKSRSTAFDAEKEKAINDLIRKS